MCRPTRGEQTECDSHVKSLKTTSQVLHLHYIISEIQLHELREMFHTRKKERALNDTKVRTLQLYIMHEVHDHKTYTPPQTNDLKNF